MGCLPLIICAALSPSAFSPIDLGGEGQAREARLSSLVAVTHRGAAIEAFLDRPGRAAIEAWVRFPRELGEDVIFGVDQELLEGVRRPLWVKGGDWMGLVGVQRTGTVWVAVGTDSTMAGIPSKDRKWEIRSLGQSLRPDTWYRMRNEVDFASRRFVSFELSGPGIDYRLPLGAFTLDYPNMMPFSDRAMTSFVFAMRGKGLMKEGGGTAEVFFDDVRASLVGAGGRETPFFTSSFEESGAVGDQPVSLPTIQLDRYRPGSWYKEQAAAIVGTRKVAFARTGASVGFTNATLDER